MSTKTKPTTRPINTSFRDATPQDIAEILAIERCAFTTPWSQQKFLDAFENPAITTRVILHNNHIVGYLLALESIDFVDILNIAIHPNLQRQNLGKSLLDELLQRLDKNKVHAILLEVRVSNVSAIHFYQQYGFEWIDTREKYYSNLEDAKILHLLI
ncbi:MAG: ribosomal protein S18-alanine N-acetyltransferase [Candidatus Thioglobus sp.]|nr:ribosomal protein S18-alanine N-acetyltransferase [Candidatus Thioglobus sp.]MBT4421696.1 ribosomal protein S18-alanine N-acetyltransferase [Candidatus Thioglobus sp.]MBT4746848.1 ribosomal protein S18-alanine N-acetyltransferase [Candidatus Thioglobus sp.]MBT5165482.1 ribosomal protein S18-alanine N-acetyltransferase [Candidatus Thioglobus sp.]MBT6022053.1 ribosomal protein S18-alanine N-acetyltransferase [Candidatus Thioglobus sp.]